MFNINHYLFIQQILPPILRKLLMVEFIHAGTKPLREVWFAFLQFRTSTTYKLQFNGQVMYLEQILNETFDPINQDIYITDDANIEYTYIGLQSETPTEQVYIGLQGETPTNQAYIGTLAEYQSANNFIVNVPATVTNLFAVRSIIDQYKLAGKKYLINVI